MKVAVLIAGMYREFETAVKTWKFLNDPRFDCDIYFSTWDMTYEQNKKLGIDIKEQVTAKRIEKIVKPIRINIEPEGVANGIVRPYKMIHRWKRAISMMKFSEIKYDLVILLRPDLFFNNIPFGKLIDLQKRVNDDSLFTFTGLFIADGFPSTDDRMLIGSQAGMYKLLTLPVNMDHQVPSIHNQLGIELPKRFSTIDVSGFDAIIVRSNSRGIDNWDECSKQSKDWWNAINAGTPHEWK